MISCFFSLEIKLWYQKYEKKKLKLFGSKTFLLFSILSFIFGIFTILTNLFDSLFNSEKIQKANLRNIASSYSAKAEEKGHCNTTLSMHLNLLVRLRTDNDGLPDTFNLTNFTT